ncbi:hypothetical protein ABT294_36645 [Nonomuraea sp. NPDC000554]|uniref:hypothetical protein n=1 Tax=Nonomuraea sp. NPDC000554 TaxID=3154259 RepID=UPI003317D61E
MKQKGFTYIAYVRPEKPETDEVTKRASGDYQAMRKWRERYGFGVFAEFVYPKELDSPLAKPDNPEIDPNWAIQSKLSAAQGAAFRKASDACMVVAAKQVLGKDLKSGDDYFNQINKASDRALAAKVDSDPQLIELAAAMASCLKGKGNAIGKTTPQEMYGRGFQMFNDQADKLGRAQRDDVPDVAPPAKDGENKMTYMPDLSAAEAKPYLAKEIKAALDDLECGKDFYPAYLPKAAVVNQQVNDEFGM